MQNELDTFAAVWNSHTVRSNRHSSLPSGRPNVLHAAPVLWGYGDKLFSVDESDVEACMSQVLLRSSKPCDEDIYDIAVEVMKRDGLEFVENKMLLQALYLHLRREIKIVL